MRIFVTWGSGEATTELSAFDAALYDAGIANYNLIPLSSVIPENSDIIVGKINRNKEDHGYRLYVVISRRIETSVGRKAVSGLGWLQKEGNGKGLFAEKEGNDEIVVKDMLEKILEDFQITREDEYERKEIKINSIECKEKPVCSVVCAVFKSEKW